MLHMTPQIMAVLSG